MLVRVVASSHLTLGGDITIAKTLRNSAGHEINRVFIIYFPNRQARDRFFDDEAYREIRGRLFEPSVRDVTTIGEWEVDARHSPDRISG